jgi:hypothetical protein
MTTLVDPDRPWLTAAAIVKFEGLLKPDWNVLEYGSGGSTVWLAERVRRVLSLEHKKAWALEVNRRLAARGLGNALVLFVPPDVKPSPDKRYHGSGGRSYRAYVRTGAWVARTSLLPIDLVFIDGRARVACVMHAIALSPPIVVLDNSERGHYKAGRRLLSKAGYTVETVAEEPDHTDFWTRV